jgi:hypothetical protein
MPLATSLRRPHVPPAAASSPLTARQRQILDWIRGYLEAHGMPPTRA